MRVISPLETGMRGGFKTVAASPRIIEKSSASSALDMQSGGREHGKEKPSPHLRVELVCQGDTQGFDPFWDGPRLLPAFVAQLLGQAMPERGDRAATVSAYRGATARAALLVDRRS